MIKKNQNLRKFIILFSILFIHKTIHAKNNSSNSSKQNIKQTIPTNNSINNKIKRNPTSSASFSMNFLKKQECSNIFSKEPPLSILPKNLPEEYTKGTNSTFWYPICSALSYSESFANHSDEDMAIKETHQSAISIDLCAIPQNNRYDEKYVTPSQKTLGVVPLTRNEILKLENAIRAEIKKTSSICCPKNDKECIDQFIKTEIFWCQPKKNPDDPDDCMGLTHATTKSDNFPEILTEEILKELDTSWADGEDQYQETLSSILYKVKKHFSINTGKIVFAPYKYVSNGEFIDQKYIVHEAAHVCSTINRELGIKRNQFEMLGQMHTQRWEKSACQINSFTKMVYEKLFANIGLSNKTIKCLFNRSIDANFIRFSQNRCPNGCPQSYLEESYAQAVYAISIPESVSNPTLFPNFCSSARDSRHSSGADDLGCFAETPFLYNKLKKAIGCREH